MTKVIFIINLTSQRSSKMTFYLSPEVKTKKIFFCIMHIKTYVFWAWDFKNGINFSFWPLRGRLKLPLTSHHRSKLKKYYFALCISKHRFFGLENSKMASILTSWRPLILTFQQTSCWKVISIFGWWLQIVALFLYFIPSEVIHIDLWHLIMGYRKQEIFFALCI